MSETSVPSSQNYISLLATAKRHSAQAHLPVGTTVWEWSQQSVFTLLLVS
jgi:hypothetical protein